MKSLRHFSNPLITGTLLLTVTGLTSRVIGFFYRIFLSRAIGAEGLGIYQLIFPVFALCIAFSASGIQTAISRFVAACHSQNKDHAEMSFLYSGMILSILLSLLLSILIRRFAGTIAEYILDEPRCADLLIVIAYSLPCAGIHACINGYYYGCKKTLVPAATQLLEQSVRVISVYVMFVICKEQQQPFTPDFAVWGVVCGEFASMLASLTCIRFQRCSGSLMNAGRELFRFALPLTTSHVTYHIFASVEAVLIPLQLKAFGYTNSEALSVFGILNGMSMPMILFPSVIVNSISVLLMPAISEAYANRDYPLIKKTTKRTLICCLLLGFTCTFAFLLSGRFIGRYIFQNTLAGSFILILSWICPFLYLSTTLSSILHGLGRTVSAFFISLSGCCVRILFIFCLVPAYGIRSYLYGLLASELITSILSLLVLVKSKETNTASTTAVQ